MTQENKELLLKDLCARVPYHPKGRVVNVHNGAKCDEWLTCASFSMFTSIRHNCRLYLRPMSSMTEDEANELDVISDGRLIGGCEYLEVLSQHYWTDSFKYILLGIDWLNAHHFDYRGLIEKGLAIEAPEGMY